MANPFKIYVDDTSPSITYFPFGDTFGVPDRSAGWNPYYDADGFITSPNQTSQGNSFHLTSLDGASFSVKWSGTNIQLFGNSSQATYNITLDGVYTQAYSSLPADNLLVEFQDLSDADHTLTLTVHTAASPTSDSYIAFDKAIISAPGSGYNSSTLVSQIADNNDIAFLGQWSFISIPGEHGRNDSFHQSTHADDRFEFTFQGQIVTLYGLVSADCGQYSVTLDNKTTTLSARSSSSYPHALLFYATDLDDHIQHQLVVQNEENRVLAVRARGLNYTSFVSSSPLSFDSSSAITSGTKAAIALACVLSFLLILIVLCYFFVYRSRIRRNNAKSLHHRHEKAAEAGISVLDISAETRALARRGSGGTSFGFAGFRFGRGSQHTKSIGIDSYDSWRSFKGVARRTRIDRHSQWDTFTIDLPSISPMASQRSFRQQPNRRDRFPSGLRPPRLPKSSYNNRSAHARLGTGVLLLNNWGVQDDGENDTDSAEIGETDYRHAVEFSLSPRTSVAHFLSGIKTSVQSNSDVEERGVQSRPESNTHPPQKLYLNVQEGGPFKIDFVGIGGSRDSGTGRFPLPQEHPQREAARQQEQSPERLRELQDGRARRISQVKFDTGGPPYPKLSFLDFGSSVSSDASSSSQRSEREKSRWSATTPSQTPSVPDTESSALNSINFDVPPIPPSPIAIQQSSSFSLPVSMPHSLHHLQVPTSLSRSSRRHSNRPITGQLSLLSVPSSYYYPESRSASPTDSVPVSVSDIHFRHLSTSDEGSHRTSAGSQLPPHPPLPCNESPPELPSTSLIVQKLFRLNTSTSMSPMHTHMPNQNTTTNSIPEPGASAPFMQRVLGFGAVALNPRHNRTPSHDVLPSSPSPKSSSSEKSRH